MSVRLKLSTIGIAIVAVAVIATQALASVPSDIAGENGAGDGRTVTWTAPAVEPYASVPAGAKNVKFVALATGCRIFDTRVAGGPFSASEARDLSVRNASLAAQGGNASGCNVPNHAVAVDISLSTVGGSPTGSGYVRVGPGGSEPSATVLQFLTGQGTSVTTGTTLAGNGTMRVKVFSASTHVVGDVLGYWQRTLHATVNDDGTLRFGSGVTTISHGLTGFYVVTFERDISDCSMTASPATLSPDARTRVELNGPAGEVFVYVQAYNGTSGVDKKFQLVLEC